MGYSEARAKKNSRNRDKGVERLRKAYAKGTLTKENVNRRGYNKFLDISRDLTVNINEERIEKFDIATVNSVYTWIGKYVTQEKALSLEEQSEEDMARKSKDDQIRELRAQLKHAALDCKGCGT